MPCNHMYIYACRYLAILRAMIFGQQFPTPRGVQTNLKEGGGQIVVNIFAVANIDKNEVFL